MTNDEMIYRQFMQAVVAIKDGRSLSDFIPDTGDFGRQFRIDKAFASATTTSLPLDDEEHQEHVIAALKRFGVAKCPTTVADAAKSLIEACEHQN